MYYNVPSYAYKVAHIVYCVIAQHGICHVDVSINSVYVMMCLLQLVPLVT